MPFVLMLAADGFGQSPPFLIFLRFQHPFALFTHGISVIVEKLDFVNVKHNF